MDIRDRQPLTGIRVVEISCGLAGAITGKLLVDQGAEVVRVRLPDARAYDLPIHKILDQEKQVLDAEVERDHDRAQVLQKIQRADVLINAHCGALIRLGLNDHPALADQSERIHVVMTGFPSTDTLHANITPWEGVLNAACGLYTDVNLLRKVLGLNPVYSALPHASVYGAVHAAVATTLALIPQPGEERRGQRIEIPLAAAGLSAMGSAIMRIPHQPSRYDIPRISRGLARYLMPAIRHILSFSPIVIQSAVARYAGRMIPPTMESYRCSDGSFFYVFAIDHASLPRRLLEHLGIWEELVDSGLSDRDAYQPNRDWNNVRESANLTGALRRRIHKRLAERFRQKPAFAWEQELIAVGIPCAVVRSTAQWLRVPELRNNGIVEAADGHDFGIRVALGNHTWVRHMPNLASWTPRRREGDALLSGIRVLDLSTMVAGPVAARTLGDYGAEVIKVVNTHPRHGPRMVCWYGVDVDQGKRSVLLNLKSDAGRKVLRALLATADVVVHNFGAEAARRLGLSPEDLAAENRDLVVCRVSAFRGPREGPWSGRRGYDPVLQAASGVMARYGDPGRPEHHGIASCIDYLTGFSMAFGAGLALLDRSRRQQCGIYLADTSLAQSANLIQAPYTITGAQKDEPSGQTAMGDHALHRLYRTRDGWIFLAAPERALNSIIAAVGAMLPENGDVHDMDVQYILQRTLRRRKSAHWKARLHQMDATVWVLRSLESRREEWVASIRPGDAVEDAPLAQILRIEHLAGGQVDVLAPGYARLSQTPLRVPSPAPKPGANTREILEEIGYANAAISAMLTDGAAAEQLSDSYLPP